MALSIPSNLPKIAVRLLHVFRGSPTRDFCMRELQRRMPEHTHKTITRGLTILEDTGIISKTDFGYAASYLPRYTYRLASPFYEALVALRHPLTPGTVLRSLQTGDLYRVSAFVKSTGKEPDDEYVLESFTNTQVHFNVPVWLLEFGQYVVVPVPPPISVPVPPPTLRLSADEQAQLQQLLAKLYP